MQILSKVQHVCHLVPSLLSPHAIIQRMTSDPLIVRGQRSYVKLLRERREQPGNEASVSVFFYNLLFSFGFVNLPCVICTSTPAK